MITESPSELNYSILKLPCLYLIENTSRETYQKKLGIQGYSKLNDLVSKDLPTPLSLHIVSRHSSSGLPTPTCSLYSSSSKCRTFL